MSVVIEKLEAKHKTEHGSAVAGRLRTEGRVPGIVYGEGIEQIHVHVPALELSKILAGPKGKNTPIELDIEGEKVLSLPREVQAHPIKPLLIHVDFIKVDKDKKVEAVVPLHLIGVPEGVKSGGRLGQYEFSVAVLAPSINIPVEIKHDISAMEIDDRLMLNELALPEGVVAVKAEEEVMVAQVFTPRGADDSATSSETEDGVEATAEAETPAAETSEG